MFNTETGGVNKIVLVVAVLVGVLAIGGGASAYFYWSSPEKRIERMFVELSEVKTIEYTGEVRAEITMPDSAPSFGALSAMTGVSGEPQAYAISTLLSGAVDLSDLNNPKDLLSVKVSTDALQTEPLTIGLEMRHLGKVFYVKATDLPKIGFFDLSAITDQWIKIDIEELKQQLGLDTLEVETDTQQVKELSPEQVKAAKKAIQEADVFVVTEKLTSEKISDRDTYHYEVSIDKTELKTLILRIVEITGEKPLGEKELEKLDEGLASLADIRGEIWLGKQDLLPYKIAFRSKIEETEFSKSTGTTTVTILFTQFNQPVEIHPPEQTKSVTEVFGLLLGGAFAQPTLSVIDEGGLPAVETTLLTPLPESAPPVSLEASVSSRERDSLRLFHLRQIQTALELYYIDQNAYPVYSTISRLAVLGTGDFACLNASGWSALPCANPYLSPVPQDPGEGMYTYVSFDGKTYQIRAELERPMNGLTDDVYATPEGIADAAKGMPMNR